MTGRRFSPRRALFVVGERLVSLGVVALLFAPYELIGTGRITAQAQLRRALAHSRSLLSP